MSDTIFALSSGHGRAGVAVIRISGDKAAEILVSLSRTNLPSPRYARLRKLYDPASDELLDQGLVLWFPGSASFTGEPCVELHLHGGRAVVSAMLRALGGISGLRLAERGEFTRRALENGKLDLAQVEALSDLIDADTLSQRKQALYGLDGGLGEKVKQWRDDILEIKALIAADIDFSDEGDVGQSAASGIDSYLQQLETSMTSILSSAAKGRLVNDGIKVALVGSPNVGKSTLMNALAGSDVAIVTEHAGTTRDVLEVRLELDGYLVRLSDTAGVREATDPVERIGIARTAHAVSEADIVLLLDDRLSLPPVLDLNPDQILIRIRTKIDTNDESDRSYAVCLSAITGEGLDKLKEVLIFQLRELAAVYEPVLITRTRQIAAMQSALASCSAAREADADGIEFVSFHVQNIDLALSSLLGTVGVEEVLGAIFSRFCVGK